MTYPKTLSPWQMSLGNMEIFLITILSLCRTIVNFLLPPCLNGHIRRCCVRRWHTRHQSSKPCWPSLSLQSQAACLTASVSVLWQCGGGSHVRTWPPPSLSPSLACHGVGLSCPSKTQIRGGEHQSADCPHISAVSADNCHSIRCPLLLEVSLSRVT